MACAKPLNNPRRLYNNKNSRIPCRYCINCRVDKRKQWAERCKWEFKDKISGAFVTFTYDDAHLFSECLKIGNDKKVRASLNYEHSSNFIKAIKSYIKRNPNKQNILMQENFTYLGVGEYGHNGSIWNRPHYHILFFGLDFKYCEKLFKNFWQYGFIDSLPILKGGINYVLKYMDKQIIGKQGKWENYKRYNLEAPKQFQSKGLGNKLYLDNYKNIQENKGFYKSGTKLIPVPQYYKQIMGIKTDEKENNNKIIKNLAEWNININNPNKNIWDWKKYNYEKEILFRHQLKQEQKKARNLYQQALNRGEPIINTYDF